MKKLSKAKKIIVCTVVTMIFVSTYVVSAMNSIKSTKISSTKVYWQGQEIPLQNQLISVVKRGEEASELYMPLEEVLNFMNIDAEYNSKEDRIDLVMKNPNNDAIKRVVDVYNSKYMNIAEHKNAQDYMNKNTSGHKTNVMPHDCIDLGCMNEVEYKTATDAVNKNTSGHKTNVMPHDCVNLGCFK